MTYYHIFVLSLPAGLKSKNMVFTFDMQFCGGGMFKIDYERAMHFQTVRAHWQAFTANMFLMQTALDHNGGLLAKSESRLVGLSVDTSRLFPLRSVISVCWV